MDTRTNVERAVIEMLRRKAVEVDDRDLYPASDGVPMEDSKHCLNAMLLMETLRPWLAEAGIDAFLAANNFVYYQHGDPKKNVGPDFYVVLGAVDDVERDCWRVWNEGGRLPQVIVEFLSRSTARKDRVKNFALYRDVLGVRHYFMCDNRRMRLEGYVLEGGVYVPQVQDQHGRLYCDSLGLSLGFQDGWLRWFDSEGKVLPSGRELAERVKTEARAAARRAEDEARRADDEARRAEAAEAEVARLRALLEGRGAGSS